MDKIYRILGKRGRTTVPYELRVKMGIHPNDLVSFRCEGDEIIIKREKICDNCKDADHAEQHFHLPVSTNALREFLTSLPTEAQRDALVYLSMQLTQGKA